MFSFLVMCEVGVLSVDPGNIGGSKLWLLVPEIWWFQSSCRTESHGCVTI